MTCLDVESRGNQEYITVIFPANIFIVFKLVAFREIRFDSDTRNIPLVGIEIEVGCLRPEIS